MVRLRARFLLPAVLLVACTPVKAPVADWWPPTWIAASTYTEDQLTDAQKGTVHNLEPAGGEGRIGLGFTEDFDRDGRVETVSYGAYRTKGESGNFVLVTRKENDRTVVLLLREFPGTPEFTVFTLKPDGSLWFGGGIDAGEVTMNITWNQGVPVFHKLTGE